MPLPPAPTKRAALLNTEAFDAPAKSRSARRPTEQSERLERTAQHASIDSFDRTGGGEVVQEMLSPE
ncbi:MAG: PhoH family protein, partial [Betaproteobacteria bacterium]|nr:PhoH family protein [Betaproteobacteria bacterium]